MQKFCAECGTPHECAATPAGDYMTAEVKIAKINADRDVEIARLQAGAAKAIAATEAEHSADFAEGKAEGLEEAITGGEGEEAEGGEPIVVEVPAAEPEAEADDIVEEPPVITTPAPTAPKRGGYWDAYR